MCIIWGTYDIHDFAGVALRLSSDDWLPHTYTQCQANRFNCVLMVSFKILTYLYVWLLSRLNWFSTAIQTNKRGFMMCNVTIKPLRAIKAALEKYYYILWRYVYSLEYPERKAHASSFICVLFGCNIFFHIIHIQQDFRKKNILLQKSVVIFSATLVSNISDSKKNWERYDQKRT
jgi:hypothetical protein